MVASSIDWHHAGVYWHHADVEKYGRPLISYCCGLEVLDGARYAAQDDGQGHGPVDGEGPGLMNVGEVTTASQ